MAGDPPKAGATVVSMAADAIDAIRAHGRATFPDECCGALIDVGGTVVEAFALENTTDGEPRRRFRVDARDYLAAERRARGLGGSVAGFYHSHPNAPARPSAYDLEHAWPNLVYAIVSVVEGVPDQLTAWWLRDDRKSFVEVPIRTPAG
ncbi:MAG: M67 family metallopeptidase [Acidobacteria bacterium]|nr:M67 family metallopeptidase [Acidobacteriota bacterium]